MDGFRFKGTHSSAFGCFYIPPANSLGSDMEDYTSMDQEIDGRDGGYHIGNRVGIREIQLECYFEDIDQATREGLQNWLHRNTSGELVLDRRPYVTYDVVPSKRIVINQYAHGSASGETLYSGTFTAYFKCYSPFGRMTMTAIEPGDTGCYGGTGLLSRTMMPPAPTPSSKSFLVYCPGTERANTLIRLAGDVGDGLTIHNATTGQRCRIDGLRINSLPPGSYISIDSAMGQVLSHKGDDTELAYHFHDLGYVQLAPCLPLVGNVELAHTAGSKEIRSRGAFLSHMTGQYVYLGGWKKIHRIDSADVAHLMTNAETTGASTTPIATMNEVYLEGEGFNLSRFELEYTPRIR